jgi:X-X-X-Leu-X-X-Gly heptad repeat protein
MKKSTAALLLAVFASVAIVAPMAQGTGRADRLAALEKKVKALQGRLSALESTASATRSDVASAKSDIGAVQQSVSTLQSGATTLQSSVSTLQSNLSALRACVGSQVLPISRYRGYLFSNTPPTTFLTTALDITEQGQTPGSYVAAVNASCVTSTNALRLHSQLHLGGTTFHLH